jgi:phage shock protein PspC (stress-responsive transcriptional regulator)
MKKTIDVNIAGYMYHIDQDAYEKLLQYFNKLEKHYGNNEEAKEIVRDIEQRVSELLNEKKTNENMVFSLSEVDKIISILGTPEDLFEESEEPNTQHKYKTTKKLYRPRDSRIFAGVAAGVSEYLGIPVLLTRTLLVIFTWIGFGSPVLIYIVMWIVVPEAKTPAQKLEMKGKPINVDNIEKTIKKEYEDVKASVKENTPKVKSFLSKTADCIGNLFSSLGSFVRVIIGVFFAVFGLLLMVSFILPLVFANTFIIDLDLVNVIPGVLMSSANLTLFTICLLLICCIPFFLLAYAGIRLIFNFNSKKRYVVLISVALWFFALINLAIIGGSQLKNFEQKANSYSVSTNLESTADDLIYISNRNNVIGHNDDIIHFNNMFLSSEKDYTVLYGAPRIKFEKSETSKYEIVIRKFACSNTMKDAFDSAEEISYKWHLQDSTLNVNRFFKLKGDMKWKNQKLTIHLKIPVGKKVCIDEYTYEYADIDNSNFRKYYRFYNSDSAWVMQENGDLKNIDDKRRDEKYND